MTDLSHVHNFEIIAAKARLDTLSLLVLAVFAGAFVAFGALLATTVMAGTADAWPWGVMRLLGGMAFSFGLILVVLGRAELFTGNNLMVMAWAGRTISLGQLLRVWVLVYLGNFVGAVGIAVLVFLSGQYAFGEGAVGKTALAIAGAKTGLPFLEALVLAILCNVLVCLGIWLAMSARTVAGKVFAVAPPVTAFVAAGFEHSIANMYFLPVALLIKWRAGPEFWQAIAAAPGDFLGLTAATAAANIVPVTIGNVIGGALVGAGYWFAFLRHR